MGTDIIDPCRDLSGYKVVFAPNLYLINPEIVANLEAYVRAGGWLVMGCKSGLKNWNSVFFSDLPPAGGLAEIFGATTLTPAPPPWYGGAAPATALNMDADAPFAAACPSPMWVWPICWTRLRPWPGPTMRRTRGRDGNDYGGARPSWWVLSPTRHSIAA